MTPQIFPAASSPLFNDRATRDLYKPRSRDLEGQAGFQLPVHHEDARPVTKQGYEDRGIDRGIDDDSSRCNGGNDDFKLNRSTDKGRASDASKADPMTESGLSKGKDSSDVSTKAATKETSSQAKGEAAKATVEPTSKAAEETSKVSQGIQKEFSSGKDEPVPLVRISGKLQVPQSNDIQTQAANAAKKAPVAEANPASPGKPAQANGTSVTDAAQGSSTQDEAKNTKAVVVKHPELTNPLADTAPKQPSAAVKLAAMGTQVEADGSGAAEKNSLPLKGTRAKSSAGEKVNLQNVEQQKVAAQDKIHGTRVAQQAGDMNTTQQRPENAQQASGRASSGSVAGLFKSLNVTDDPQQALIAGIQAAKDVASVARPRAFRFSGGHKSESSSSSTDMVGAQGAFSARSGSVGTLTGTAAVTAPQALGEIMLERIENMQGLQKNYMRAKLGLSDGTKIDLSIRTIGEEVRVVINVPNAELKQALTKDWKRLTRKASDKGIQLGDPLIQVQSNSSGNRFSDSYNWISANQQAV